MAELKMTLTAMQGWLGEAEAHIAHLEETSEWLVNDSGSREKHMDTLWYRVQVLENHNRRTNVRLVRCMVSLHPLMCNKHILINK